MTHDSDLIVDHRGISIAKSPIILIGVIVAIALYLIQARALMFTQDDAFISYRYAQNALDGHGLVYNVGERVEGYTNFLWVIWLMIAGKIGIGFDIAAKASGLASGIGMIVLTALLVRRLSTSDSRYNEVLAAVAAVWIGANGALAYWSVSGLETALFGFLVTLSVLLWCRGSKAVVIPIALSVLTRPEGGLVWIILAFAEWFRSKDKKALGWQLGAVAILLTPFAVFKLLYYGDLLPNPFHAKTGVSLEYLASGASYLWEYLRDYGLWGAMLIPVIALLRGNNSPSKVLVWLCLIFTAYVVAVGGDVLRPHRFFVPMLPIIATVSVLGLAALTDRWRAGMASLVTAIVVLLWAGAGWVMTRESLAESRRLELALTDKMMHVARNLRGFEEDSFAVAASTIGRLGFDLPGCRIIDMLGLTDREIARNPERIPGIASSWKERNFNAGYVLRQQPEYILFSTGYKPSAPAERALLLHSNFRRGYFGFVSYDGDRPLPAYRRKPTAFGADEVWPDIRFADAVIEAFNFRTSQDHPRVAQKFIEAHYSGPGDFGILLAFAAIACHFNGDTVRAMAYADSAIAIDSSTVEAWRVKTTIFEARGDTSSVSEARRQLAGILKSAR